jgi:uncharacterized paraquat-inducible protein A
MSGLICPECESPLKFGGQLHRGKRIHCARCKASLEVVDVKPPVLEIAAPANRPAKSKKEAGVIETMCPQCDHIIKLSRRSRPGEKIVCAVCHTQLQIISVDPLELDIAQMIKSPHKRR